MPTIDLRRAHQIPVEDARHAVETVIAAIGRKFGIRYQWRDDRVDFSRTGVKGHIEIAPDTVHVRAELGFLLAGMQSKIENEIETHLDRALGPR
ncbi:MAG: polyhydroxyalkanoic acid system family protein [Rhodanobacteraceae bacterium]